MDAASFDPRTATEAEIKRKAERMVGRSLGELAVSRRAGEASGATNKGEAGSIIEQYFNIERNNDQAPDFVGAGIELKSCPLVRNKGQVARVKERTSISMIDYMSLDTETWPTASVRKKLRRILFVFYEWEPDVPLSRLRVRAVRLWSPTDRLLPYLERDWLTIWSKNRAGMAHQISEKDGVILSAATKGASGARRSQPHSSVRARSRAWSLKPRFTLAIYNSSDRDGGSATFLTAGIDKKRIDLGDVLVTKLQSLVGMSVAEVARAEGIRPGGGKNRAATVVRKAIGLAPRSLPPELEALSLEIKTVPVGPDARPYESMSFPAFDHRELVEELWEDSDLFGRIQNMLLVPLFRERRSVDLLEQRVCRPFRWAPNEDQLAGIEEEWTRYRDLVARGRADDLPGEASTRFVHVRPHGKDGQDTVNAPGNLLVARKCFWFNRGFLRQLVLSANDDWKGF